MVCVSQYFSECGADCENLKRDARTWHFNRSFKIIWLSSFYLHFLKPACLASYSQKRLLRSWTGTHTHINYAVTVHEFSDQTWINQCIHTIFVSYLSKVCWFFQSVYMMWNQEETLIAVTAIACHALIYISPVEILVYMGSNSWCVVYPGLCVFLWVIFWWTPCQVYSRLDFMINRCLADWNHWLVWSTQLRSCRACRNGSWIPHPNTSQWMTLTSCTM